MTHIRGANLGNWLVLEKWMDPELFRGSGAEDETWLARKLPPEEFAALLKAHRDSYVTEDDFRRIAEAGLNAVRLPVPYHVFGDRPPMAGCVEYVDLAFRWAERYGLKILLDLHTVPGSQNGFDNGGITGVCKWARTPKEVEFALTVLERLATRYGRREGLYGIEVLNEPAGWLTYRAASFTGKAADRAEARGSGHVPMRFLRAFYAEAYQRLRRCLPADKVIVFHDGFRLGRWNGFFLSHSMVNVRLDTHFYLFAPDLLPPVARPWAYRLFVGAHRRRIRRAQKVLPVIVGEWCAGNRFALQGRGEAQRRERYSAVARMQLDAWRETDGWFYWSYRLARETDASAGAEWKESWDLCRCLQNGWLTREMIGE